MNISLVVPSLFGKRIVRKNRIYAPGPLTDLLIKGLKKRGHAITLFAPTNSDFCVPTVGEPIPILENELRREKMDIDAYLRKHLVNYERVRIAVQSAIINRAFREAKKRKTDIIHFYCAQNYLAYSLAEMSSIPTLFTIHDPIPRNNDPKAWNAPELSFPKLHYVTVSKSQQKSNPTPNYLAAIHNSIEPKNYNFSEKKESYIGWIGRPTFQKGPDVAVRVAKKAGVFLKLAGPEPLESQKKFWKASIGTSIKEKRAEYLGLIFGKKRMDFFKKASGILFPIRKGEAFGMVMIEAMACGTPVIAFDVDAVSEIIVHGKTGFIVKNEQEMVTAIKKLRTVNPADCRKHVEKNFSAELMVQKYEKVYEKLVRRANF